MNKLSMPLTVKRDTYWHFSSVKHNQRLLEVFLLIFLTIDWVNVQLETTLQPNELMSQHIQS